MKKLLYVYNLFSLAMKCIEKTEPKLLHYQSKKTIK